MHIICSAQRKLAFSYETSARNDKWRNVQVGRAHGVKLNKFMSASNEAF